MSQFRSFAVGSIAILAFTLPLAVSAETSTDVQAQINSLVATIAVLQAQLKAQQGQQGGQSPTTLPPTAVNDDENSGNSNVPSCRTLTRTLLRGSTDINAGGEVSQLQGFLTDYFNLNVDISSGYYGVQTEKYVKAFQSKNGIDQVGYVGKLTRAAIANVCGGTNVSQLPNTNAFTITSPAPNSVLPSDQKAVVKWNLPSALLNAVPSGFNLYVFLYVEDVNGQRVAAVNDGNDAANGSAVWNVPLSIQNGNVKTGTKYKITAQLSAQPVDSKRLCAITVGKDCSPNAADAAVIARFGNYATESGWFTIGNNTILPPNPILCPEGQRSDGSKCVPTTSTIGGTQTGGVKVTAPNGGEQYVAGSGNPLTISWNATGIPTGATVWTGLISETTGKRFTFPSDNSCRSVQNGTNSCTGLLIRTSGYDLGPDYYRAAVEVQAMPDGSGKDGARVASDQSDRTLVLTGSTTAAPTCKVSASKTVVAVNEPFTVSWTSTNATYGSSKFGDKIDTSGTQQISVGTAGPYTYPIIVYGPGGKATCSVGVNVFPTGTTTPSATGTSTVSIESSTDNLANAIAAAAAAVAALQQQYNQLFGH